MFFFTIKEAVLQNCSVKSEIVSEEEQLNNSDINHNQKKIVSSVQFSPVTGPVVKTT